MDKSIKTSGIITAVVSVIMFALSNMIYVFNYPALNPAHTGFWFVLLQCIIMIKYIAAITVLMPRRIIIKQAVYGLIVADIIILSWTEAAKSTVLFPYYIITGQVMMVLIYLFVKGRLKMKGNYKLHLNTTTKFTIETINA
jgi:hypothetical protein